MTTRAGPAAARASLTMEEFQRIAEALIQLDLANIPALLAAFAYEGFDFGLIAAIIRELDPNLTFIKIICAFDVERGTNATKALQKMSARGKTELQGAMNALRIKPRAVSKEDLTIQRVVAIAAPLVAKMYQMKGTGSVASSSTFGIPTCYQFPAGASLLYTDSQFESWLKWANEFDKVINSTGNKKPDPDNVLKFGRLAYENRFFTNDFRQALGRQLGL